ncbi:hypothetical protein RINTU1_27520 [Candidatus Regiella insecticola]|uniref:Uncharacterized protein n=1 Tax=Candidatus Regiella insecticola TaxID=138073 RepID=A0A6L2ZQU6_9ENTR|nr:hypothetical protein RINTU1_27520 [Candidatus Regiella insecticola]
MLDHHTEKFPWPEASSSLHQPVYYMKENEREVDTFKTSPDFDVFKKQYEEAINKIIQFYNEHSPDKGREILIEDLLPNSKISVLVLVIN